MKPLPVKTIILLSSAGPLALAAVGCATDAENAGSMHDALSELHSLTEEAPDDFAGLTLDEETKRVTVYVVAARRAGAMRRLQDFVQFEPSGLGGPFELDPRMVTRSKAELDSIRDEITRDHQWVADAGGELRRWGPKIERNVVEVGVAEVTPRLEAAARERFGASVELIQVAPSHLRNRVEDAAPWKGGIDIRDSRGVGQCSTGWAIENASNPAEQAITTAGHCYPLGEPVTNFGRMIGSMVLPIVEHSGLDIGFISGDSYGASMYFGPFNSDLTTKVKSWVINPTVGMLVCVTGAVSGSSCEKIKIRERGQCEVFFDENGNPVQETCGLSRAATDEVAIIATDGDSGGGVYVPTTGGVSAVGSQVGGATADETWFHEIGTFMPQGWRLKTQR